MPGEVATACPACGGFRFHHVLSPSDLRWEQQWLDHFYVNLNLLGNKSIIKDRTNFTQCDSTYVLRCIACGTLLRNPQPSSEELTKRYQLDRYEQSELEELLRCQRGLFREKKFDLPQGARIFELGSFVGAFLEWAEEQGWNGIGIDIGNDTSAFCRARGLHVTQGELSNCSIEQASADAFFIWNTFDQLGDPLSTLRIVRRLLRPNGVLVIRVPNGAFESAALQARANSKWRDAILTAQAFNNFLTFPYVTGYTPSSLRKMLEAAGFSVKRISGDTLPLFGNGYLGKVRQEERRWSRLVKRICHRIEGEDGTNLYPWFEITAAKSPRLGRGDSPRFAHLG